MLSVKEINPDFALKLDQTAGEKSSESKMDIFFAERERLKRIVAGFGLGPADGEDVLQDVSIKVLERSGENRTNQEYIRWLTKVTVNRCLTEHRRRRTFRRNAQNILSRRAQKDVGSIRADEKTINAEELEAVRKSMQKLDESLLGPVILKYFCDFNSIEIGEMLGLKPPTVRSRLRAGRMFLAKSLLERGVGT
jgi:RNA polymerase sigma-70 factor (ECF subfamily)